MKILLFNLAIDEDDQLLGFAVRWIKELAKYAEEVHAITMREGRHALPDNVYVYSVGKERGLSEARRSLLFYWHLMTILKRNKIDICFSHMIPIFTVLAAPILKLKNIPVVTWYAHPSLTNTLKIAHKFSNVMITSLETAYPYKKDRLVVVGQGIDTELFSPNEAIPCDKPHTILCVGRLSPVKDHQTLLKAISILKRNTQEQFRLVIVGGPTSTKDEAYIEDLKKYIYENGINKITAFKGVVSMLDLPSMYNRSTVHVNMTPTGSGDKVVLEAMACGKPSIAANDGFRETMGKYCDRLLFESGDSVELAERLLWAISMPSEENKEVGEYLRRKVVEQHSIERLGVKLMALFNDLLEV